MESLCCGTLAFERVVCYVREAMVVGVTLLFEQSLLWFLFTFGSLLNDATPKIKWVDEDKSGKFADVEYDDAGKIGDDGGGKEYVGDNDQDDDDGDDMSGEEGSDDGDEDSEHNAYASGDGGSDDEDENDEDEDENDFWEDDDDDDDDDDDEDDDEDYEEEDQEEEMDQPPSKKTRSLPTSSDETTGSEYEEDTDDDSAEASLLKHAREVYNSDSFRMYKDEYKKSRTLYVDVSHEGYDERGLFFKYKAEKIGHHFRQHTVTALPMDGIVNCSCKYFDVAGILCSHAQFVLRCLRIERIPDRYILKRRTKNESCGNVEDPSRIMEDQKPTQPSFPDCLQHSRVTGISSDDDTNGPEDDEDMGTDCVDAPLLSHAREIYIPDIFCMFCEEYRKSEFLILDVSSETYDHRGIVYECEISKPGHYKYRKVHAESKLGTVNCSCKKFEYAGILCSHALYVLDCLCIDRIPTQYILGKFLKDSTRRIVEGIHGKEYANLEAFARYKMLTDMFGSLANLAAKSEEAQRIVSERLNELRIMLDDMPEEQNCSETDGVISCESGKGVDLNVSGSTSNAEEKIMTKSMDMQSGGKLRSAENELKRTRAKQ